MDYYTENELLRMTKNDVVDEFLKLQEIIESLKKRMVIWYEIAEKIKEFEEFKKEYDSF